MSTIIRNGKIPRTASHFKNWPLLRMHDVHDMVGPRELGLSRDDISNKKSKVVVADTTYLAVVVTPYYSRTCSAEWYKEVKPRGLLIRAPLTRAALPQRELDWGLLMVATGPHFMGLSTPPLWDLPSAVPQPHQQRVVQEDRPISWLDSRRPPPPMPIGRA